MEDLMQYEAFRYGILLLAGICCGFINVIAGGGSLITLPLLITDFGLSATVANASNRLGIISQNIFAVAGFRSKGIHAFPYSLYLAISALIGALLGAKISIDIDEEVFQRLIAIIMVAVALLIVFKPNFGTVVGKERMTTKDQLKGVGTFFFIGIYGGFIQAGVGFLIMPALIMINRFPLVKTNSAKVFIALVYTLGAVGVFAYENVIHWQYGLVLATGTALGGWISSRWSVKKGDKWVKRILVVVVIVLAIRLWFF